MIHANERGIEKRGKKEKNETTTSIFQPMPLETPEFTA